MVGDVFNNLRLARQRDAHARQSPPIPGATELLSDEALLKMNDTLSQLIMISEALDRRIGKAQPFAACCNFPQLLL